MKKPIFYTEFAYGLGLMLLALGTAFMAFGGFGISMVTAPAYVLFLKISQLLPGFSFGIAEYLTEALVILGLMILLRRVKLAYFLSFLTAVLFAILLDGAMAITALLPQYGFGGQLLFYLSGFLLCACAISLILRSYMPPAAYELFVKELAAVRKLPFPTLKTIYDCCSLAVAVVLSLLFFDSLQGIGIGTVLGAFFNGMTIRLFTKLFDKIFVFHDLKRRT